MRTIVGIANTVGIIVERVPLLRRPVFVMSVVLLCFVPSLIQLILYGCVSLVGMGISFGVYAGLVSYHVVGYVEATFYGLCAAFALKIFAQRRWVFKRKNDAPSLIAAQTSLLVCKYLGFWITNVALLHALVEHLSFDKIYAQAIAIPLLGFLSFLVSLRVFKT